MRKLFTILVMLGIATIPVFAGPIEDLGLFNTGSPGWMVNGNPATTATTNDPSWVANNATSSWISTQANTGAMTDGASPAPAYNYTFQFTVPAQYALSSIVINGRWAVDDYGTADNGGTVFSDLLDAGSHYTPTAFANQTFAISGLTSAANTLTFMVTNKYLDLGRVNPTGVRVEFTSATGDLAAIPEPGTLVLLGGGLLALGFFRRRR